MRKEVHQINYKQLLDDLNYVSDENISKMIRAIEKLLAEREILMMAHDNSQREIAYLKNENNHLRELLKYCDLPLKPEVSI